MHDLRQKERMNLIYDNKTRLPKLACSTEGLVALLSDGKYSIQVVDMKKPGHLLMELKEHKEFVNQALWANPKHLLSAADDGFCLIWDISAMVAKYSNRCCF